MDGVVREPSALAMTVGSPPSRTLTQEFVVPRSMPTARAMVCPRYSKVEWSRLNDATRMHVVKSKLSQPGARSPTRPENTGGTSTSVDTCPVTAYRHLLSCMHRSGTLYP